MVIVDFSHLAHRNLYTAISLTKPKKINGKYEDSFMNMFYHLMLNSLRHIQKKFSGHEIILAIDSRKNWRKEIYPEYKEHRKNTRNESDINFDLYFKKLEAFINILDKCFPYKVIKVENAEADDIIAVISKKFNNVIIVTSDKDLKQCLLYNARMYDPIKQTEIKMSKEELQLFKQLHILLGDSSDNIPNVMKELEYTKEFIQFLNLNNIYQFNPEKLESLEIFEKLKKDFEEKFPEKEIYKKTRFGEKTALKFIKENKFEEYKNNSKFIKNYERNQKLIDFEYIPKEIENKILEEFKTKENHYNGACIQKFLIKFNLNEQFKNMNNFFLQSKIKEDFEW